MEMKSLTACPSCGSSEIYYEGDQYDHGMHFDYMMCVQCGTHWTEEYTLTKIIIADK